VSQAQPSWQDTGFFAWGLTSLAFQIMVGSFIGGAATAPDDRLAGFTL
jgi:hypothetical protein